ncbi:MAG: hypothetical protein JF888_07930 [Candidatus Dormibacteraeota bacterium]|uniref:Uncharacterized protein n=1 Tax=Candidatus Dormiibacter inghamiae TaxID=3127013 RepID=A0A934KE44_9BACT|nr:hypothetical protein [Candidatus Dormibacteraeota bacterium]MBJ7606948.1 hypothetical protein [Candidatus Dormibacteraeota bacterium]
MRSPHGFPRYRVQEQVLTRPPGYHRRLNLARRGRFGIILLYHQHSRLPP